MSGHAKYNFYQFRPEYYIPLGMFFGPFASKASPPDKIPPSFCQQCQGNIVAAYVTLWPVFPAPHTKARFFSVVAMMLRKKRVSELQEQVTN